MVVEVAVVIIEEVVVCSSSCIKFSSMHINSTSIFDTTSQSGLVLLLKPSSI